MISGRNGVSQAPPVEKRDVDFDQMLKKMKLPPAPKKAEEKFNVRIRTNHSFNMSTIAHLEAAYDLTTEKTSKMTMKSFCRLVKHNGPIAVTMSNSTILIGHPYDF